MRGVKVRVSAARKAVLRVSRWVVLDSLRAVVTDRLALLREVRRRLIMALMPIWVVSSLKLPVDGPLGTPSASCEEKASRCTCKADSTRVEREALSSYEADGVLSGPSSGNFNDDT